MKFKKAIWSIATLSLLAFPSQSFAQKFKPKMKHIYHKGWIDLNKNGTKDIYEDSSQPIENRIADLISQMTLEEKTNQLATLYGYKRVLQDSLPTPEWKNKIWKDGIANIDEHLNGYGLRGKKPLVQDIAWHLWGMNKTQEFFIEQTRLGIPVDFSNEAIRGVEAYGTTDFPAQIGLGSTWNRKLLYKMGQVVGREAKAMGYSSVYTPILDVSRDQRWGRIEETYGEAPYLVAELGEQVVKGIQEKGDVASTLKHYVLYSANFGAREGMARTDPQIPMREALALLVYPFEKVIKRAHPLGVMASYNDYDGVPIAASKFWLTEKLRQEFGFNGYVVSDSDAVEFIFNKHHVAKDREGAVAKAVNAGLNVRTNFESPKTMILPLRKAIKSGKVSLQTLNSRVADVLRVKFMLGLFDQPYVTDVKASRKIVNSPEHRTIALQAAHESIVLLKNENHILPLSKNLKSIAVIGPNVLNTSYSGARYGPHGVKPITLLEALKTKLGPQLQVNYAKGIDLVDVTWPESEVLPQPLTDKEEQQIAEAVAAAKKSQVAVLMLGLNTKTSGENKSRTTLALPGHQLDLAKAVYATGVPTIVVFINANPISFNWIKKHVPGIVEAWYPGEQGGTAIADVLFGDYNPGGKLSVTFPRSVGQLPMNFPSKPSAQTDVMDLARLKGKLYPFGYGLSYTTFKYSNLKITPQEAGTQSNIEISFNLTNTGDRAGDEIPQLYVHQLVTSVTTFEKNLRGFDRIHLKPGETKTISFTLTPDDLSLWNAENQYVVEPGTFQVMIGASSEDIKLKGNFILK